MQTRSTAVNKDIGIDQIFKVQCLLSLPHLSCHIYKLGKGGIPSLVVTHYAVVDGTLLTHHEFKGK